MTKYIFPFVLLLLFITTSCDIALEKDKIYGTWRLTEAYSDPGNGTGTFRDAIQMKTITFFENGSFIANGPLCVFSTATGPESGGTYSLQDSTLTIDECPESFYRPVFEVDRLELTILLPCEDGCGYRFKKISNN